MGGLEDENFTRNSNELFLSHTLSFFDDGSENEIDGDLLLLYLFIIRHGKPSEYWRRNQKFIHAHSRHNGRSVKFISAETHWITDVIAVFETSLLAARLTLHDLVANSEGLRGNRVTPNNYPEFCGRFLFLDGDYTNIYMLSFLCFLVPLSFLTFWSLARDAELTVRGVWEGALYFTRFPLTIYRWIGRIFPTGMSS